MGARGRKAEPTRDFILGRIAVEDRGYLSPCWIWQLCLGAHGYARTRRRPAHRIAYEEWAGPIPDGLEIDHLCRVPSCVNPGHLEPVTKAENLRRKRAAMTHCKRGHALTPENLMDNGRRGKCCRACRDARLTADDRIEQSHCRKGHELKPENTIIWKGRRRCLACNTAWRAANDAQPARDRARRRKQRLREAAAARIIGTGGVAPNGQRPRLAQGHIAHDSGANR